MAEMRQSGRSFTWAPRALAVISCALALLAVQPAMGMPTGSGRRGAVLQGVVMGGEMRVEETSARAVRGTRAGGGSRSEVRGETWLGGGRKLHILATMEILRRLVISELRGYEGQAAAGLWVEDVCLGTVEVPVARQGAEERAAEELPMREREYAIGHCLLAPPVC